ncbi:MAG: flippase [Sulfuritalea sp.]|jgi:O-antigen/teichoic acid export membrane protein|nr:flippase [Sulfuritalea sp.]
MQAYGIGTLFQSATWYLSEKLIRMAGAFLIGAWVARYLGPEQYGTLAFALALTTTLGFLASWGVETLVVRDLALHPERASAIISTYFFARLAGALTVPLFAYLFLAFTHQGDEPLQHVTLILAFGISLVAFDVADCWLQSQHRSRRTSLIRIVGFSASAMLKIALVLAEADIVWFAVTNVIEALVIAFAYDLTLRRHGVILALRNWDQGEFCNIFLRSKGMILSALTVVIYSKIDVLAVGSLLSKEALGAYAMATTLCGAWNMLGMSLSQAFAPHISKLRREGRAGAYLVALRQFLLLMLGISVAGSLFLALLSPWIFDLLLGPPFAESSRIFTLLVWSSVPVFMGVATSQIIVNEKVYWVSMLRTALGMVVSVALIIPVVERFGVMGTALLVVVSAAIATLSILFSPTARDVLRSILVVSRP